MTDRRGAEVLRAARGGRRVRFAVAAPPRPDLPPVPRLLAGAAEVDLTPPPGMPKAGYSSNAHDGNGFRTRLKARVLHLRAGTASLAWVQCDLLGGSAVVQRLVAEAVADRTDIPLAGLMIGATHTHAGPGQFLGTDFYNRFASNRSGFDPGYAAFLVDQIADAVVRAHDQRGPARLAVGSAEVWGFTRNRSLAPHVQNDTVADKRTEPQRKYVSVNPELHLVRVDRDTGGAASPLGAAVVFSVHGTGISMKAPEYNADIWAYLTRELAGRVEAAHGTRPVVGAVEGTHADVAPNLRPGLAGYVEAERVGRGVGAAAFGLYQRLAGDLTSEVDLAAGLREVDLEGHSACDGVDLPRRPFVGAALVAGAHENLTPVIHRVPPFRAGSPKWFGTSNPQGEKWVLGSRWLQPLVLPLRSFPRVLPVQVLRIGPAVLVGLPFEITVESGRRIAGRVAEAVGDDLRVIVSSVANEYAGYVATAEEYRLQHYEGGHTLYGPATQPFLAAHAARLAADALAGGTVTDVLAARRFDLRSVERLATPTGRAVPRRSLGAPAFTDPTRTVDGYWEWSWLDVAPGDLCWHEPLVRVDATDDGATWAPAHHDGQPVDDQGWDLEVVHVGVDEDAGGHRYRVRWFDPAFRAGRRHRFVLVPNNGTAELTSPGFD